MITVHEVEELPDGGAIARIEFDAEGLQLLLQEAVTNIFEKAILKQDGYKLEGFEE